VNLFDEGSLNETIGTSKPFRTRKRAREDRAFTRSGGGFERVAPY